jgi:hypothetical protein
MSRDIRRHKPQPPPKPKLKPKPKPPAPVVKPPPVEPPPIQVPVVYEVVGYVKKYKSGLWTAHVGERNQPVSYHKLVEPVKRMKDAVAWIKEVCDDRGYELKEIVRL